ncbi:hypothetical protein Q8F55_002777 [Vanrija albida]|uniref:C3H1-type domain-containing protein n=1 Tax=Vanrija albida TaxID=181172 RepID=A0ABR3QAR4_9TREE
MEIDYDPLTLALHRLAATQDELAAQLRAVASEQARQARALDALTARVDNAHPGHMLTGLGVALADVARAQAAQGAALLDAVGDIKAVMRAVGATRPSPPPTPLPSPVPEPTPPAPQPQPTSPAESIHTGPQGLKYLPPAPAPRAREYAPLALPIFIGPRGLEYTPPSPLRHLPVRAATPPPRPAPAPPAAAGAKRASSAPPRPRQPVPRLPPKPVPKPAPKSAPKPAPLKPKVAAKPNPPAPAAVPKANPASPPAVADLIAAVDAAYCRSWNMGTCRALVCPLLHECFACHPGGRGGLNHRYDERRCRR